MADTNQPKKLEFADEKIAEVTKKISGGHETKAIFAKMNELGGNLNESTTPTPHQDVVIRNLRTFQGDVADAIKKQNASVLSITLAEKKKKDKEETQEDKHAKVENHKRAWSVLASILLIILGVGTVGVFYYLQKQAPAPSTPGPAPEQTIVGYNTKKGINVDGATRQKFLTVIAEEKNNSTVNPNEITYLYLNKEQSVVARGLTTKELFTILDTKIPGATLRSFGDQFMFGFFRDENIESFLLIHVNSFDIAYDGMLKWENTIASDIGSLFYSQTNTQPTTIAEATTTSTTTPKLSSLPKVAPQITNAFEDETFANKDARVLKNSTGKTLLLYSFLDKETLLITSNENTLKEMVNKLISQKLIR